ncbi:MAG: AAA family ATPase [Bacteroidetes bacterium]|nr:AAA family ATPase [Bacteroidota bacterium]
MKRLPIGRQNFEEIINENLLYVDKTRQVYNLIQSEQLYFLSRPRRFGKSLLISTFRHLFSGKKELFKDLYIGNKDGL